jgi:hypothetical protein
MLAWSGSVSGREIQPFTRIAHSSCSLSVDQRKQIIVDRQCGVPQGSNCYVSYFVRVPVAKRDAKFH